MFNIDMIKSLFENNTFLLLAKMVLIISIIYLKLNKEIITLLNNNIIRVFLILLIFYTSLHNLEIALLLLILYVVLIYKLNTVKLNDLLNVNDENSETVEEDIETVEDIEIINSELE